MLSAGEGLALACITLATFVQFRRLARAYVWLLVQSAKLCVSFGVALSALTLYKLKTSGFGAIQDYVRHAAHAYSDGRRTEL
jgi:hypothetical protein